MDVQTTAKLTYDDYVLIPDDGLRHEIIDGEHYVSGRPGIRHQRLAGRLLVTLANFVEEQPIGEVFPGPLDVLFSRHDVVQPDIVYVSSRDLDGAYIDVTPELVVEILSADREHDEVRKLKLYDTFNVPEYWIVDPEDDVVKIYRRRDGRLTLVETVDVDGMITTPLLPGFSLAARAVFD